MNGENPVEAFQKKAAEIKATQVANKEAQSLPLPGAAADAFVEDDSLKVTIKGKEINFRPFYDSDFKVLQKLGHPIVNRRLGKGDETYGENPEDFHGENCWIIAWMLTKPAREVRKLIKEKGGEWVKEQAEDDWSENNYGDSLKLGIGAMTQVGRYFATVVQLESTEETDSKKNPPT